MNRNIIKLSTFLGLLTFINKIVVIYQTLLSDNGDILLKTVCKLEYLKSCTLVTALE